MAIDQLLETRTLIAAINSPDLEVPEQFFISNYWGAPRSTYSKYADIVVTKGSRGLARFRQSGQEANVVGRVGQTVQTVQLPYIREKKNIEAAALTNPQSLGQVYITGGQGIEQLKREAIAADLVDLKNRILRREEWMAAQILTTGKVIYADDTTSFTIDFQMPTANKPVLSGGSLWTATTADIDTNLIDWSQIIEEAVGTAGEDLILGTTAAKAFLKNEAVKKNLDTNNFPSGRLTNDVRAKALGTYNGLNVFRYSKKYTDDNGNAADYFPANGALLLPSGFKTDRLFGVVEEVGQTFADPFFSKSWEEHDPSVLWMLASSRPLPIVEEAGSWVFAIVTA